MVALCAIIRVEGIGRQGHAAIVARALAIR